MSKPVFAKNHKNSIILEDFKMANSNKVLEWLSFAQKCLFFAFSLLGIYFKGQNEILS